MELPASIILTAVRVLYAVVLLFLAINLLHLFRFGLTGPSAPFVALLAVGLAAVVVSTAWGAAQAYDWTASLTLPFGG